MRKLLNKKSGFTLIELMIVVAILGILAAIAIPAFVTYVRRSKTTEAHETIKGLFNAVASYYTKDIVMSGLGRGNYSNCTIGPVDTYSSRASGAAPNASKIMDTADDELRNKEILNFNDRNSYYYVYNVVVTNTQRDGTAATGVPDICALSPISTTRYMIRAYGDLDTDTTISTFELAVGTTPENDLYHAAGVYIVNEVE